MAYFCTPDLEVLEVVAGPVSPAVFLEHARRAAELAERLEQTDQEDRGEVVRLAHEARPARVERWSREGLDEHNRLTLLAENPLIALQDAAVPWFEALTREKASDEDVRIVKGRIPIQSAEELTPSANRAGTGR